MSINDIDLTLCLALPQVNLSESPDNEYLEDHIVRRPRVSCRKRHFHFSCGLASAEDKDFLRASYPWDTKRARLIDHNLQEGEPPQPFRPPDINIPNNPIVIIKPLKTDAIDPPFEWATDRRAKLHTLEYILSRGINQISDNLKCKNCGRVYNINYELNEKFNEIESFFRLNDIDMHNRVSDKWKDPILPNCESCGKENSLKPEISNKKKSINWLFLFLGSFIGCCTSNQLKYFCKYTNSKHRTGAKDRLIYHAYKELCRQLKPSAPLIVPN